MVWVLSLRGDLALSPQSWAPAAALRPQGLLLPAHFGTPLQHSFRLEDPSSAFTPPRPPSPRVLPVLPEDSTAVRHEATHRGVGRVLTWNAQRKGRGGMGFKSWLAPRLRWESVPAYHEPTLLPLAVSGW